MYRLCAAAAFAIVSSGSASAQLSSAQLAYPPAALRAGHQGAVGYEVKLAKDGKVIGCRVTQTSGFADLDKQTCAQLQKTAWFKPAVNADGKPTISKYVGRLQWKLPRPPVQAMPSAPASEQPVAAN